MGLAERFTSIITTPADLAEQTAVLAAAAAAGGSFQRGLMPRTTTDQAAITGLLVAMNYGIVVTGQSATQALAGVLAGHDASPRRFRASAFAVEAATLTAGLALQRAFPAHPGEPLSRAALRSVGFRSVLGASAALMGLTVTEAAAASNREARALPIAPLAVMGAGVAAATYGLARHGDCTVPARRTSTGWMSSPTCGSSRGRSAVAGAGVAAATFVAAYGERLLARGVAGPVGSCSRGRWR